MMEIGIYAHTAQARLSGFFRSAFGKRCLRLAAGALAGFALSAGALAGTATPLALGLLCAAPPGALAVAIAVGGCAGYWLFWRELQGFAWMAAGLLAVAITGDRPITRQQKLLLPAVSAMLVSGCGVAFLLADLETPWVVDPSRFHSKSRNTPFEGATLYGRVKYTFKGGRMTYKDEI